MRVPTRHPFGLTEREIEVLETVAREGGNEAAAAKLKISIQTVKNHLTTVHKLTGTHTTAQSLLAVLNRRSLKPDQRLYRVQSHELEYDADVRIMYHIVTVESVSELLLETGIGRSGMFDFAVEQAVRALEEKLEGKRGKAT
jgi:DNA-binding CsgD family transcriptional regulator